MPLFVSFIPKHNFKIRWNISEGAFLFNEPESHWKCKKVYQIRKKNINPHTKKRTKNHEKSDFLFLLSYLPPLSDFPFFLTPPPSLKSDIIYVRSIRGKPSINNWKMVLVQKQLFMQVFWDFQKPSLPTSILCQSMENLWIFLSKFVSMICPNPQ